MAAIRRYWRTSTTRGRVGPGEKDGTIVFVAGSELGLHRVSANGGPVEILTTLDAGQNESGHNNPSFLPGGRGFSSMSRWWDVITAQGALLIFRSRPESVKP